MSVLDSLDADVRERVLNASLRGDYNVLLGAGVNFGSVNRGGDDLPMAAGLARGLADHFGLQYVDDLPLMYDRAVRRSSEQQVFQLFQDYFSGCEPAPWVKNFTELVWRRVWTFNVDDVVENAYKSWSETAWQTARPVAWDNTFRETAELDIVHLHGYVGDGLVGNSRRLVFGIAEYLDAREEGHAWHRSFGEQWQAEPFITIGASLVYEYDFAKIFRARRPTSAVPSLYVSRSIDRDMREDLSSWGIVPVEATAEAFLQDLRNAIGPRRSASGRIWSRVDLPIARIASFSANFRHLNEDDHFVEPEKHDLYAGDEPLWSDIVNGRDALLPWVEQLSELVDSVFMRSAAPAVEFLAAPRFAGVTAGLLRLAKLQNSRMRDVFWFRAEQRFDVAQVLDYLSAAPPTILIFDGIADFADDLGRLLTRAKHAGITFVAVASERDPRAKLARDNLPAEMIRDHDLLNEGIDLRRLGRPAAVSLVRHMREIGRLGRIADMHEHEQVRHFTSNGLFAGMEGCSLGLGFRGRVSDSLAKVGSDNVRCLIYLAGVLDTIGYDLPISMVGSVGLSGQSAIRAANGEASAFLQHTGDSLHPRLRRMVLSPASSLIGQDKAVDTIFAAVRDLKPFVNTETQFARTRPARIVAGLMRARALKGWIGADRLDTFFERLATHYGKNSRYWEQRAIAMELLERWSAAEGYARKATQIGDGDPWRLNTLGSILLSRARREGEVGGRVSLSHALEGAAALQKARDLDPSNFVPLSTLLENGIRFIEAHDNYEVDSEFLDLWQRWWVDAKHHDAALTGANAARLLELNESLLRAVVARDRLAVD